MTPSFEWDEAKAEANDKKHACRSRRRQPSSLTPWLRFFLIRIILSRNIARSSLATRIATDCWW